MYIDVGIEATACAHSADAINMGALHEQARQPFYRRKGTCMGMSKIAVPVPIR